VRSIRIAALLCLGTIAWAQPKPAADVSGERGLTRVVLRVPEGVLRINFPDDMAAGDQVTGTVYPEPDPGKNEKEKRSNIMRLGQYGFDLGGRTSMDGNRVHWQIPSSVQGTVTTIQFRDGKNKLIAKCEVPINPRPADTPGPAETPRLLLPLEGEAGRLVSVWGSIPAEDAEATIGGKAADLIAQGPRKAVFLTPPDVVGQTTIAVKAGHAAASGPYYSLGFRMAVSRIDLHAGDTSELTATVSGLNGLSGPAHLTLVNITPAIAAMKEGILQRIIIQPGDARPDGTFQVKRTLIAENDGRFAIDGSVTRSMTARLPFGPLAGETIDRWARAGNVQVTPDARAAIVSGFAAERARLDEFLAAQSALGAEPGSLFSTLIRLYCFEVRNIVTRSEGLGVVRRPRQPMRTAFVPEAPAQRQIVIRQTTVSAHPVLEFLGKFLSGLAPSSPLGTLTVSSSPAQQQPILIDGIGGDQFLTDQVFALGLGTHEVNVKNCRKTVQVAANLPAYAPCDVK
jgi:hypothetical protein